MFHEKTVQTSSKMMMIMMMFLTCMMHEYLVSLTFRAHDIAKFPKEEFLSGSPGSRLVDVIRTHSCAQSRVAL
jgi:hypothetical protein